MVKSKKFIAGLGVVAGLGMAMLPLGAFAAESNNVSHTIRGVVGDVISVALTSDNKEFTLQDNTKISKLDLVPGTLNATLEHVVTVSTNTRSGYGLQMYGTSLVGSGADQKAALKYITAYDTTNTDVATAYSDDITIDSITTANDLTGDNYGWGYKVKKNANSGPQDDTTQEYSDPATSYAATFAAIPTAAGTNVATVSADRSSVEDSNYSDAFTFNYGIRPTADQLAGAYEGTVVYRAISGI